MDEFLAKTLGGLGYPAVKNLLAKHGALRPTVVKRVLLGWVSANTELGPTVPGFDIPLRVHAVGGKYTGLVKSTRFENEPAEFVAAVIGVYAGLKPEPLNKSQTSMLERLGKSIDLMLKVRPS